MVSFAEGFLALTFVLVVSALCTILYLSLLVLRRVTDASNPTRGVQGFPATSVQPPSLATVGDALGVTSSTPAGKRSVKEPQVFHGNSTEFKEWSFSVTLALKSLDLGSPEREATYAASFLAGNARLWLISSLEAGEQFTDWPVLRDALGNVYGPRFDEEQVRLRLFSISCQESIDSYISSFSRLSLQVPELDERCRALLFVNGLRGRLKGQVLREHPTTLSKAVQAALTVAAEDQSFRRSTSEAWKPGSARLTADERERLRSERACFRCRRPGHLAHECPRNATHPNAGRQ